MASFFNIGRRRIISRPRWLILLVEYTTLSLKVTYLEYYNINLWPS